MKTFLLIGLFIIISFLDYKHMLKEKKMKALIIYTSILGIAFLLSEMFILGMDVVGLNQLVTFVVSLFET